MKTRRLKELMKGKAVTNTDSLVKEISKFTKDEILWMLEERGTTGEDAHWDYKKITSYTSRAKKGKLGLQGLTNLFAFFGYENPKITWSKTF